MECDFMNKILLVGRLVKDPELKVLEESQKSMTRIVIAVDRGYKNGDGERKADFIPVSIWGKKAEIICKYLRKGSFISVSGRLRTGTYEDRDGNKKYLSEVVAEDFHFVEYKKKEEA